MCFRDRVLSGRLGPHDRAGSTRGRGGRAVRGTDGFTVLVPPTPEAPPGDALPFPAAPARRTLSRDNTMHGVVKVTR